MPVYQKFARVLFIVECSLPAQHEFNERRCKTSLCRDNPKDTSRTFCLPVMLIGPNVKEVVSGLVPVNSEFYLQYFLKMEYLEREERRKKEKADRQEATEATLVTSSISVRVMQLRAPPLPPVICIFCWCLVKV